MARRSKKQEPEQLRTALIELLQDFESKLTDSTLREQVLALIPATHLLRDLGSSLVTGDNINSARTRILSYLQKYPRQLLHGDELMVVAGISEYARRIRELRVQYGWPIVSGTALNDITSAGDSLDNIDLAGSEPKTDSYVLLNDECDRDAAYRWNISNEIRKRDLSVKEKILAYIRKNVGKNITGEELKYLAKDKSEWARRVRELRTEDGWPIATRTSGLPSLPVGVYVLLEDRQAEVHDRKIPDSVRAEVLERDQYECRLCSWSYDKQNPADRRSFLELHHIEHHAKGGGNTAVNLITLCNVCHDSVHKGDISTETLTSMIT